VKIREILQKYKHKSGSFGATERNRFIKKNYADRIFNEEEWIEILASNPHINLTGLF
jgi:hypothetical protein